MAIIFYAISNAVHTSLVYGDEVVHVVKGKNELTNVYPPNLRCKLDVFL